MGKETQSMLKHIGFFDAVVGAILALVVYFVSAGWVPYILLGLFISFVSLLINAFMTGRMLTREDNFSKLSPIIGFAIRVVLVTAIGILLYIYSNTNNMIAYIIGYTTQFISLVLYSIFNKK